VTAAIRGDGDKPKQKPAVVEHENLVIEVTAYPEGSASPAA
jgi:hypothetical protein